MKKLNLAVIFLLLLMLAGCKEYGEKRIVKLITVNKDDITLYYYDYSLDKPGYSLQTKENTGIQNTLVQLLSENIYDLKLCRYAVCEKDIIEDNIDELVSGLINSKFSTDTVVIQGDTTAAPEKYIQIKNSGYPIYSYYLENGKVNGVAENPDEQNKNIIIQGRLYRVLSPQSSFAMDIIKNNIKKGTYTFKHVADDFSAQLENISVFYSVKNDVAYITVNALLKSYKGMPSNTTDKHTFVSYTQKSLEEDIRTLFDDVYMAEKLKLDWFEKLGDFSSIDIAVEIR